MWTVKIEADAYNLGDKYVSRVTNVKTNPLTQQNAYKLPIIYFLFFSMKYCRVANMMEWRLFKDIVHQKREIPTNRFALTSYTSAKNFDLNLKNRRRRLSPKKVESFLCGVR